MNNTYTKLLLTYLLLAGTYTTVWAQVPNILYRYDSIQFETNYPYLEIDTNSQELWQIGTPSKTFFNAAYEGTKAIVTDTVNTYPTETHAYFDIKVGLFNHAGYMYNTGFYFKHKYDTDAFQDGAYLTISLDYGENWINIFEVGPTGDLWEEIRMYNVYGTEDTLYNGEYGFSGHSGDWVYTALNWGVLPVTRLATTLPDTMIVRFNFIADNIDSAKEGWMIDDILFYGEGLGSGITNTTTTPPIICPNPIENRLHIDLKKPYQNVTVVLSSIFGNITREYNYTQTQNFTIERGTLKAGMYCIQIRAGESLLWTEKIVLH